MRFIKIYLVLSLGLTTLFLQSCNEDAKPKRSIKSASSKVHFLSPKSGSVYTYTDSISFEIESKVKSPLVKKISLYINDSLIAEVADVKLVHSYAISGGPGGQLKVVGSVEFEDGTSSTKRLGIKVNSNKKPTSMSYELIQVYPHDPSSFTQGLIYDSKEDILIEGSGNYTESRLMKVKLGEAQPIFAINMDDKYFGEGVTMMNDTIYQLTYKNKKGFYYDREFKLLGEFTYPTEGWGLTHNGKHLIMSDGSANLYFIHPRSFKIDKNPSGI